MTVAGGFIATIFALIVIVVSALSYIRAMNAVCDVIREKKPGGWEKGLFNSPWGVNKPNPKQVFWYGWLFTVVLGLRRLDIPDDKYRQHLWIARANLTICVGMWLAWIIMVGWLFRSTT